jgi:hypothetical protein
MIGSERFMDSCSCCETGRCKKGLPDGEYIVWQGIPDEKALARRVFYSIHISIYLATMVAAHTSYLIMRGDSLADWSGMLILQCGAALIVLALISGLAKLYQKSTIYTLTNERLVILTGAAFSVIIHIPVNKVQAADLREFRDGTGDISVTVASDEKLYWLLLWPSVRSWWSRPVRPLLRNLKDPRLAAEALAKVARARCDVTLGEGAPQGLERDRTPGGLAQIS